MKGVGLLIAAAAVLAPLAAGAQESQLHAEFRREFTNIAEDCGEVDGKKLVGCATTLLTDHPVHVAVGSIAPQNGFGIGPAFVSGFIPNENWRIGWTGDAVAAFGGAWRAGAYLKFVRTAVQAPRVVAGGAGGAGGVIHEYPVFNVYAQAISLPTLTFYGIGPGSSRDAQSFYGMGETIVGSNGVLPIDRTAGGLNLAVLGEVNGRFVDIRRGQPDDGLSIDQRFPAANVPGLGSQPGFVQLGEGVRIRPSLLNGRARLSYRGQLQQYIASDSTYSFQRWTIDLDHEFPIYRDSRIAGPKETNLPNECAVDPTDARCPAISRNRTGVAAFRAVVSKSHTSIDSVVPFYFQHTLGGSDIDGNRVLPSYDDYRFRGPHILWLQESIEHSIYGPVGVWLAADQGKVASQAGEFGDFLHSYAAGLTLRAGGLPFVLLSFASGGGEGHHIAFTISTSLLGGSSRPSLQ